MHDGNEAGEEDTGQIAVERDGERGKAVKRTVVGGIAAVCEFYFIKVTGTKRKSRQDGGRASGGGFTPVFKMSPLTAIPSQQRLSPRSPLLTFPSPSVFLPLVVLCPLFILSSPPFNLSPLVAAPSLLLGVHYPRKGAPVIQCPLSAVGVTAAAHFKNLSLGKAKKVLWRGTFECCRCINSVMIYGSCGL